MINPGALASSAAKAASKAASSSNPMNDLFGQTSMSHRFLVDLDRSKWNLGSWSKVTGLSVRWSKVSYRVGEDNFEHVRAGNITLEPLKLSRAVCGDSETVKKWLVRTEKHRDPFSGAVYLLDFLGFPIVTWEFRELFPVAWSIGEIDSSAGKPMIETLELAHSGFLDYEGKVS